jgi:hypothetical protein
MNHNMTYKQRQEEALSDLIRCESFLNGINATQDEISGYEMMYEMAQNHYNKHEYKECAWICHKIQLLRADIIKREVKQTDMFK